MVDQTVMSFGPSVLRKHLHQSQLCFKNIFLFYKPYSVCKSEDMSIHCYPLMSETYRQHHISGFSSHPRKLYKLIIIIRNLAIIILHQIFSQRYYIFRFCLIHAYGFYYIYHILLIRFGKLCRRRIFFKQSITYFVNTFVGSLS